MRRSSSLADHTCLLGVAAKHGWDWTRSTRRWIPPPSCRGRQWCRCAGAECGMRAESFGLRPCDPRPSREVSGAGLRQRSDYGAEGGSRTHNLLFTNWSRPRPPESTRPVACSMARPAGLFHPPASTMLHGRGRQRRVRMGVEVTRATRQHPAKRRHLRLPMRTCKAYPTNKRSRRYLHAPIGPS